MYSVEEIKELLAAFDNSKATDIELKNEKGEVLTIRQKVGKAVICKDIPAMTETLAETVPAENRKSNSPFVQQKTEETPDDGSSPVSSPMVGVFYAAPSPDSEPYVSVGTRVSKGDVLCLIEAMKLMNEVTAEKSGEITKICVENGQVVEYGQPLFMIK